jgi:hypothetical protein
MFIFRNQLSKSNSKSRGVMMRYPLERLHAKKILIAADQIPYLRFHCACQYVVVITVPASTGGGFGRMHDIHGGLGDQCQGGFPFLLCC